MNMMATFRKKVYPYPLVSGVRYRIAKHKVGLVLFRLELLHLLSNIRIHIISPLLPFLLPASGRYRVTLQYELAILGREDSGGIWR
jgi:hypothetical protein